LPAARPLIANFVGGVSDLLSLSGQDPVTPEDKKHGKVGRGVTEEEAYGHARLPRLNLLSQMRSILGSRDRASRIVNVLGMVNVADDFLNLIRSPKTGPFKARVFRDIFPWLEERKTMKASQFSDAQKAFILKQGNDGVPVADICRKAGISQATYFNWKKKYDGMQPPEMRRLKQLEDENARLKKIVADLSLDREMLQDVIRRKI
jgi:putative transposase